MLEPILKPTNPKDKLGVKKVSLGLIPLSAQIHTALAHLDGALKYGAWNWREKGVAASVYINAALRHILKWYHGEELDADSGIHHLGHAIACLNIVLDSQTFRNLVDDRPPADNSPQMLDKFREEVVRLLTKHGRIEPNQDICNEPGIIDPKLEKSLDEWVTLGSRPVPVQYNDDYAKNQLIEDNATTKKLGQYQFSCSNTAKKVWVDDSGKFHMYPLKEVSL